MKSTSKSIPQAGHEQIAQLAKEIWEREGRQSGRDLDYWLQAEHELLAGSERTGPGPDKPAAVAVGVFSHSNKNAKGSAAAGKVIHI